MILFFLPALRIQGWASDIHFLLMNYVHVRTDFILWLWCMEPDLVEDLGTVEVWGRLTREWKGSHRQEGKYEKLAGMRGKRKQLEIPHVSHYPFSYLTHKISSSLSRSPFLFHNLSTRIHTHAHTLIYTCMHKQTFQSRFCTENMQYLSFWVWIILPNLMASNCIYFPASVEILLFFVAV